MQIDSASDDRTQNNAEIGGTGGGEQFAARDLSLANTHAEDAVMRAVRHITA